MAKITQGATLLACTLGLESPIIACPFCDSSTAEKVRAGIFNSDTTADEHLAITLKCEHIA